MSEVPLQEERARRSGRGTPGGAFASRGRSVNLRCPVYLNIMQRELRHEWDWEAEAGKCEDQVLDESVSGHWFECQGGEAGLSAHLAI